MNAEEAAAYVESVGAAPEQLISVSCRSDTATLTLTLSGEDGLADAAWNLTGAEARALEAWLDSVCCSRRPDVLIEK